MRGNHSKKGPGVGARSGVHQGGAFAYEGRRAGDPLPWVAVVNGMQSHILINSEHKRKHFWRLNGNLPILRATNEEPAPPPPPAPRRKANRAKASS